MATDYISRYAETKALCKASDAEVAKFFEDILLRHGATEGLITDRGTAFTAELSQAILRHSQTSHRRTAAYHSQTNGLAERISKTDADMLAIYLDVDTGVEIPWFRTLLSHITRQCRKKMLITPLKLVYGMEPTTTLDVMLLYFIDEENIDIAAYLQHAEEA